MKNSPGQRLTTRSPISPLKSLLVKLEAHNEVLAQARHRYLRHEAQRKHKEALWIKEAVGKSHAERVVNAQANPEWLMFYVEQSRLEAVYEFQKMKMEILNKEWLAQYLEQKLDQGLIGKQED